MLIYQIVFYILVAEVVLCLLLFCPLPAFVRNGFQNFLYSAGSVSGGILTTLMRCLLAIVFLLFLDACNGIRKHSLQEAVGPIEKNAEAAHMFRAQRNFYLTFSVLFLSLVLDRYLAQGRQLFIAQSQTRKITTDRDLLKKQADQVSSAVKKMDKTPTSLEGVSSEDKKETVVELKQKVEQLKEEVKKVKKERDALENTVGDLQERLKTTEKSLEQEKTSDEKKKNK